MKQVTVEYANKMLRDYCTPAPITIGKIVRVFSENQDIMHAVLDLYHQGLFQNYHMVVSRSKLIFEGD